MRRYLVVGLGLLLGLAAAWAGDGDATAAAPSTEPGPSTQPAGKLSASQEHIAQLVAQLGSKKYAQRQAAVKELIEIGRPALSAIKAAVSDKDAERAERARRTLKIIEENLILPETYRAKIAAFIGPSSEAERNASRQWIHQRLGRTVPYLLEQAPKAAGEPAVRLHQLMFDAWGAGILSDDQKTAFLSRSVRVGWRVDQSYWPGGSRIVVLEVTGLANMAPDTGMPSFKPWKFLKATWAAELDGKALASGKTWGSDGTYLTLPEGLLTGKHKLKATVELAELEGRWRQSLAADAEIMALARGPETAPAPALPPPAKIVGRVVDDKHKPRANVLVTAKSNAMGRDIWWAFMAETHSDEQGLFELSVPFGDIFHQVVAGSYGTYHLSNSVQVIPADNTAVELVLNAYRDSHTIRGTVSGPGGKPGANLPLRLVGEYGRSCRTTTDPNGRYHLATIRYLGQAVAVVRMGDLAAPLRIVGINKDNVWDLTLEPASTLEGFVRDQDTQTPIAGATVLIRPPFVNSFRMEATTGKDGRYKLAGIPAGSYTFTATAPGHFHRILRGEFPEVTLASGEYNEMSIGLHRVALLRGKVIDDAGKPVAGALVATRMKAVLDYREQYGYVRTKSDGSFTIATAQIGQSLPLAAFRSDKGLALRQAKPMQPGHISDGLVLRMHGAARVKGTVTDPQGKPVKDVFCLMEYYYSVGEYTGADGKFDLGRIALPSSGAVPITLRVPRPSSGPWRQYKVKTLEKAPPFYLHRRLTLRLKPGKEHDLKLSLQPTQLLKISGRVVGAGGRPVADAPVLLLTGDAGEKTWLDILHPKIMGSTELRHDTAIDSTRTDKDGRWTFWTVREDGGGSPFGGRETDWKRYCVGVEGPKGKSLLVRDVVVPEGDNCTEFLIDLEAGKSENVTSRPSAAPAATQPGAGEAEIARLILQLGSKDFKDRDAAQKALVRIGEPAAASLEKAASDENAECARRAKAALAQIRLPQTIQRLGKELAQAGLKADKNTFRPSMAGLAIIAQLETAGNSDACKTLLDFVQTPRQDRLLRKEAVCALGRIGTEDAILCLTRFHGWASQRIAAREGEFHFGRWDAPSDHFSGRELTPWLTARGANGAEWTVFVWHRFGADHVWVTRPLGKDKWLPPVMTDLRQGKLAGRKDLALYVTGAALAIKSKDGTIDVALTLLEADSDKDGLPDAVEKVYGTDSRKADTDNDGVPDGKDADPAVAATPKPTEDDTIRQAVFSAVYSTCDSWKPIHMPQGGQEFKGYRGGIVRAARTVRGHFNVAIGAPQISGDSATVPFSDYFGPEAAASYRATLKKVKDTWVVVGVEMLLIR